MSAKTQIYIPENGDHVIVDEVDPYNHSAEQIAMCTGMDGVVVHVAHGMQREASTVDVVRVRFPEIGCGVWATKVRPATKHCVTVEADGIRWHAFALGRGVLVTRHDKGPTLVVPYAGTGSPLARASVFLPSEAAMDALGLPVDVLADLNTALRRAMETAA